MSTQKERRYAVKFIIELAGSVECEGLPHKPKHRHKPDEFCGAEYHRDRQIYLLREILRKADFLLYEKNYD